MQENTPPASPGIESDDVDEDFEVVEVVDIENEDEPDAEEEDDASGEDDEMEESAVVTDMAEYVFTQHKGSVFCCAISPAGNVAATGGEDDVACLWDLTSGRIVLTCTGHQDSVTSVGFSYSGDYLVTADMSGYIQVWKVSTATKMWDFETGDLNWLHWHHSSNILLAGTSNGEVWMWLIPQGNTKTFPSYGAETQCGSFTHDGKRAAVGYEDGSLRILDLKTGQITQQMSHGFAHSQPVTCVACHRDNAIVMTGSMDGTAKLFNSLNGKLIATFDCSSVPGISEEVVAGDERHSVEAVSFCPVMPNIGITASLSGIVTVWDLAAQMSRLHLADASGTSRLGWHASEPILYAAGLDGTLRVFDVRSSEPVAKYTGHQKAILDLALSKDGQFALTSSDDGTARVFRIYT